MITTTTATAMAWPSNQTLPAQSVEEVAAEMQEKVRVSDSGSGSGVWGLGGRVSRLRRVVTMIGRQLLKASQRVCALLWATLRGASVVTTESGVDVQRGESVKASQLVSCFAGCLKGEGPCASGRSPGAQRCSVGWMRGSRRPAGLLGSSREQCSRRRKKDTRHKKVLGEPREKLEKSLRRAGGGQESRREEKFGLSIRIFNGQCVCVSSGGDSKEAPR